MLKTFFVWVKLFPIFLILDEEFCLLQGDCWEERLKNLFFSQIHMLEIDWSDSFSSLLWNPGVLRVSGKIARLIIPDILACEKAHLQGSDWRIELHLGDRFLCIFHKIMSIGKITTPSFKEIWFLPDHIGWF